MSIVDKYRLGYVLNIPVSNIDIDNLATLESTKNAMLDDCNSSCNSRYYLGNKDK